MRCAQERSADRMHWHHVLQCLIPALAKPSHALVKNTVSCIGLACEVLKQSTSWEISIGTLNHEAHQLLLSTKSLATDQCQIYAPLRHTSEPVHWDRSESFTGASPEPASIPTEQIHLCTPKVL